MTRKEVTISQEYEATMAALKWWYSLPEEQRKATDIDAEPDIVDAYTEGVIYGWNNHQWIPVEESLPEKDNEFDDYSKLVIVTNGKDFWKGMYNYGGEEWLTFDLWRIDDATHWMEIVPPIKEEDNE